MKSTTRRTLIQLGLSPKYKGYAAIVEAVDAFIKKPNTKVTEIYRTAADRLNTNWHSIERNIRQAVSVIVDRYNEDMLYNIFGYNVRHYSGSIVNGDFIACLAAYVQEVHNNG